MKLINKILYKEISGSIGSLLVVVLLMLLVVAFDAISPWPFKILIDNVLTPNQISRESWFAFLSDLFPTRNLLGFFAVFVYFLSTFALSIVEYLQSITTKGVIKRMISGFSKRAFNNLESLAIGYYTKQEIGDYIYRLSYDVAALGEFLEEGILPLLTSALYLAVTLTIMFLISTELTLFSLAVLPFLTIGLYSFNSYIAKATKKSELANSAVFSFIEEALTHLKIIQAFNEEQMEAHSFGEKTDASLRSDVIVYRLDFLLTLLVGIIIAVSYSVIILYGIDGVFSGALTTGLLIVFIFYLDNLTNPVLSVIYSAEALKQSYVKLSRMEDIFSRRHHLTSKGEVSKVSDTTIRFEKVTLKWKEGATVLDNVTFEIEPGKRTGIFGVSGAGKTSIVNLILRFIDKPNAGRIFIGGVDIEKYNIGNLREFISFVPQEITLFNNTIRYNIAFGSPGSTMADVRRAAKLAAADEFVSKLPGKYNYLVGEAGGLLSGGQRQRLMLARAFMKKDAKILLFDEALSALDVKTRRAVLENLDRFSVGKTTVLISNTFEIIRSAENVIVLNKGKIIYSGSSSRLPREISLYRMIIKDNVSEA